MKTIITIALMVVMYTPYSYADMFGGDTAYLSKMYAEMLKQYKVLKNQLEEAKATSDTMTEIYEVSGEVYDEYKFIQEFSTENEIRRVTRDIQGLTGLTGLSDTDDEGKFRILRSEINRRFKDDPENLENLNNQISELERLEALKKAKIEEAARAGAGELNDKNLNSSIASSNALIAAMKIAEQQAQLQKQMDQQQNVKDAKAHEDGFIEFLDNQN